VLKNASWPIHSRGKLWEYSYKRLKLAQLLGQRGVFLTFRHSHLKTCRGTWARVTIDQFIHMALQTLYGYVLFTNILLVHSQSVEYLRQTEKKQKGRARQRRPPPLPGGPRASDGSTCPAAGRVTIGRFSHLSLK
jgi:hypothetical protein